MFTSGGFRGGGVGVADLAELAPAVMQLFGASDEQGAGHHRDAREFERHGRLVSDAEIRHPQHDRGQRQHGAAEGQFGQPFKASNHRAGLLLSVVVGMHRKRSLSCRSLDPISHIAQTHRASGSASQVFGWQLVQPWVFRSSSLCRRSRVGVPVVLRPIASAEIWRLKVRLATYARRGGYARRFRCTRRNPINFSGHVQSRWAISSFPDEKRGFHHAREVWPQRVDPLRACLHLHGHCRPSGQYPRYRMFWLRTWAPRLCGVGR